MTRDYQNGKAAELARAAGADLHADVTNGLAQGKTFEAAVAEKNFSPTILPPFSRKTTTLPGLPNNGDVPQLVSKAFTLTPGKVSEYLSTRSGGGFLVFVKAVVPVADAQVQAELPEFLKTQRQSRQYEAFSDWFQKEMDAARLSFIGDEKRASAK